MKRVLSLWLPSFSTDRLARQSRPSAASAETAPAAETLVTVAAGIGGVRIRAVSAAARARSIRPGATLAEARAILPALVAHPADPAADRELLDRLADGCGRYTPWTAIDQAEGNAGADGGGAGLWLDITGCAHLFGGEAALAEDLRTRLGRLGFASRIGVADTPGAAWAVARFRPPPASLVPAEGVREALLPLPVEALRLSPATAMALRRVGLRRIADLIPLPRPPLAERFGAALLDRLDQALGQQDEPLSPRLPPPAASVARRFAEPIGRAEDITAALALLLQELCRTLAESHQGARRIELWFYRSDGTTARTAIGTSRPVRDARHLMRLFGERLADFDAGYGIDALRLSALVIEPLPPAQIPLEAATMPAEDLASLVDRLSNRLGAGRVLCLEERPSHLPERACRAHPALLAEGHRHTPATPPATGEHRPSRPRPLLLLPWPEPIDVVAPLPDGPPALFRWRRRARRVAVAEGPERIGEEWWRTADGHRAEAVARLRDYYRIEDEEGGRYWVFRQGLYRPDQAARWYLHGMFA